MITKPLTTDERAAMVTLLKMGWFLVVTAGRAIQLYDPDVKRNAELADKLSKPLDDFLKDL